MTSSPWWFAYIGDEIITSYLYGDSNNPGGPKTINSFLEKTIILVGIYN